MLKVDLKRAIKNRGFLASFLVMLAALFIGIATQIIPYIKSMGPEPVMFMYGEHSFFVQEALASNLVMMAVPLVAAIPYTTAFIDDKNSGFLKFTLHRCGRNNYIKGKVLSAAMSGGLVLFISINICYFCAWLALSPMELAAEEGMQQAPLFLPILGKACIFFLCGALWSTLGAMFANLTMNKYSAYATPFVFFYLLVILNERYLKHLYIINPQEWLFPKHYWPGGNWGIALFILEITIIVSLICAITIHRRIQDV